MGMGGFKKGRAYQFRPLGSRAHNAVSPHSNAGMRRVRYEYLSDERGSGTTLALFRSCAGGWRESFTPAQLGDYEVREAKA
jgi:hypothetical protein